MKRILFILLLAAETWRFLAERWGSLNHLPVYIYAGILSLYLLAEKAAYRGSSAVLIFLFLYRLKFEEEVLIRKVKGYGDYV